MADTPDSAHKFRHLIPPGSSFAFVSKFKISVVLSCLAMAIGIGSLFVNKATRGDYMNWTTDFKGGTEIIYKFADKSGGSVKADIHKVRDALKSEGGEFDVSDMDLDDGKVHGVIIKTPRYGAITTEHAEKARQSFLAAFKDVDLQSANWSGDSLIVRSKKPIDEKKAAAVLNADGLEALPWGDDAKLFGTPDPNTGVYSATIAVAGLARQYELVLEKALPGVDIVPLQSYGVGAKAGDKLRNDAAKSLIYAIFLIMLYLAFRFDVRYAPGAAFATIHDAVMVVGVFSITWTEVSLTSVAAVLTVIGYSVNDTVIVFDRIRENQAKLKDKKLERIIDISINEMLVRTVLTSMTVFVVTLAMNILGDGLIRNFAFAMNIGVIVGTYSSIFLAAPLFLWVSKKWYSGAPSSTARGARAAAVMAEP
jgi:preprotein translocase subunit SecF